MPLASELTEEIKAWLTPRKLEALNASWRLQGGGYSDDVIEDLGNVLRLPELRYEDVLGYLETQFNRQLNSSVGRESYGLYSWLVELLSHFLYLRHINNEKYWRPSLRFLEGIVALASRNAPLWVFSLNHDVVVECLAALYAVPLSSGFGGGSVTLSLCDEEGRARGELMAESMGSALAGGPSIPFFRRGAPGINLLKVHGSLDVFTFRDGQDLLKLLPQAQSVDGVLGALRAANEGRLHSAPQAGRPVRLLSVPHLRVVGSAGPERERPVKIANEIAYTDAGGEVQFMRRSLLAGACRFDKRERHPSQQRWLEPFRANVAHVETLLAVGYGFGDFHVNGVVREWLELNPERRLEIVEPGEPRIPPFLMHLPGQVGLTRGTATDFLDSAGGVIRGPGHQVEKRFVAWLRREGRASTTSEMHAFLAAQRGHPAQGKRGLRRGGDIAPSVTEASAEELVQRWRGVPGGITKEAFDAFLELRGTA